MTLFKRLFNAFFRVGVLTDFIVRLSLREKLFVGFFTLSLLFISIINIVFSPVMQKVLMTQMQELQYAFITWDELAVHLGVSSASIFVVLIISICFLPIVRHALQKEYLQILLCKPLSIYIYLLAMFTAFIMSLAVLILFWWLFVAATVAIHTDTFVFGSFVNFSALFVFSTLVLLLFMFFFSVSRDFLASIFTILFTLGAVVIMDPGLASVFSSSSSVFIRMPYEWFKLLFSPFSDWVALAFNPEAGLDTAVLWAKTAALLVILGISAALRFKHTIEKVELS
jgi:hypothetical protein